MYVYMRVCVCVSMCVVLCACMCVYITFMSTLFQVSVVLGPNRVTYHRQLNLHQYVNSIYYNMLHMVWVGLACLTYLPSV